VAAVADAPRRLPAILFVDDEPDIAHGLAQALRPLGFLTEAATDPFAALALAELRDFDVAVVDLLMPALGGIELVRRLLRVDPRIRCAILTAHGAVESCDEAYRAGILRYLQKPITVGHLRAVLDELLAAGGRPAPLPLVARLVARLVAGGDEACPGQAGPAPESLDLLADPTRESLTQFRKAAVRRYLLNASQFCKGSPKQIAALAGISVASAYRLLDEYDVPYVRQRQPSGRDDSPGDDADGQC
jgi:DNA-binding NtrC family response regulator